MSKRAYGTGHLYEKSGSYYGRWRTLDGRLLNRKVGHIRRPGESDGLTRPQAERELRRMQDAEERAPKLARGAKSPTVDEVGDSLRQELRIGGARRSYLEGCESMQRVRISPRLGTLAVTSVTTAHVEAVASAMLADGLSPKTIRNVVSFLHSILEHAIERGWTQENPARRASRPGRRRKGDATLIFSSSRSMSLTPCCGPSPTKLSSAYPRRAAEVGAARRRHRHRTCLVRSYALWSWRLR
jgi:hypothetical protein